MKQYMKPAVEAIEMEATQMLADSRTIKVDTVNCADESGNLVKGESSFWE